MLIVDGLKTDETTPEYTVDDAVKMALTMADDENISISEATKKLPSLPV